MSALKKAWAVESELTESEAWTLLTTEDLGIVFRRNGCSVRTRSRPNRHILRNSVLVQELLLRVGAERHRTVIEALFFYPLVRQVVAGRQFSIDHSICLVRTHQ